MDFTYVLQYFIDKYWELPSITSVTFNIVEVSLFFAISLCDILSNIYAVVNYFLYFFKTLAEIYIITFTQ